MRDHCLLSDSCLVSLNLFECGKCRLVAVSVPVGEPDSFLLAMFRANAWEACLVKVWACKEAWAWCVVPPSKLFLNLRLSLFFLLGPEHDGRRHGHGARSSFFQF